VPRYAANATQDQKYDSKDNSSSAGGSNPSHSLHLPLLDKYSGYDHPRPLWTFIKVKGTCALDNMQLSGTLSPFAMLVQNHRVIGDLRSVNPPRLRKLVTKYADPQFRGEEESIFDTAPPAVPMGM